MALREIFDGDTRFACQHAKQFEMAFVKKALAIGKNRHGADGVVVGHQGNAAEAALGADGFDPQFFCLRDIVFAD